MSTNTDNNEKTSTQSNQGVSAINTIKGGKNADASVFSEQDQTRAVLLQEAQKKAVQAADEIADNNDASDHALWLTMQATLRVAETFDTEGAVKAYYERKTGKEAHGNTKNTWQLLTKLTLPQEVDSGWRTRFSQALAALVRQGVKADHVLQELEQRKPLNEIATKKATTYSGITRFALLFREQEREKREADQGDDGSPETPASDPSENRFLKMPDDELRAEALRMMEALREKKIVPVEFLKLEELLRAPPPKKPKK